jgi:Skp family chaperone for outer membrane proteins
MNRTGTVLLAAVAVTALTGIGAEAAELKIGVVNVREILARYKKHEDLQKKVSVKFAARRDALAKKRQDLAARVAKVQEEQGSENDPARIRAVKAIETDEFLLKLDYRELQQDMKSHGDLLMRHVLEEAEAACRRIGEAQGYFMIVKRFGPDPSSTDDREHVEAFQIDPLFYYAPSADITSAVLAVLEDAYRQGIKLVPNDRVDGL